MFKYGGIFRRICLKIVYYRYFETLMIFFTILSSIQLGVDNPLNDPESIFSKVIVIIDYVLTAIFGIEVILKVVAFGLIMCGNRSYLRNITNAMDCFIVIVTVSISFLFTFY